MSSNINNLKSILTRNLKTDKYGVTYINGDDIDEAITAIVALLPNKITIDTEHDYETNTFNKGFNAAVNQTRRNLIGEQHGDSNSPRGATKPLGSHVMPEAPASGKEER